MRSRKPVSDLQNSSEVLRKVAAGHPVVLPGDSHEQYASADMEDRRRYELFLAQRKLLSELDKGFCVGKHRGWLSAEAVFEKLKASYKD